MGGNYHSGGGRREGGRGKFDKRGVNGLSKRAKLLSSGEEDLMIEGYRSGQSV